MHLSGKMENEIKAPRDGVVSSNEENMVVTPWEVKGEVDYDKLIQQFGTQPLTTELLKKLSKHTGGLHLQLQRKLFFSHRDLEWILDEYDKGNKFSMYTGRGPSGPIHLGHLMPWVFCKYLQDTFKVKLWFQLTDDEKFMYRDELSLENIRKSTMDNLLDIIAIGFRPEKTHPVHTIEPSALSRTGKKTTKKKTDQVE
jgi:tryptophanyl-tRNA synthetase